MVSNQIIYLISNRFYFDVKNGWYFFKIPTIFALFLKTVENLIKYKTVVEFVGFSN